MSEIKLNKAANDPVISDDICAQGRVTKENSRRLQDTIFSNNRKLNLDRRAMCNERRVNKAYYHRELDRRHSIDRRLYLKDRRDEC